MPGWSSSGRPAIAPTVRQLCREAKGSDRYFYEQFDSTEDLLLAVYDECTRGLEEADPRLARVVWFEVLDLGQRGLLPRA